MSERARSRVHSETLTETTIKYVSEDYQMKAGDRVVFVDSTDDAVDIKLPPMAEAVGKFYFIQAPVGATNDVSVLDHETGTEISTYGDMDADDDHALFFCTGRAWIHIYDGVA